MIGKMSSSLSPCANLATWSNKLPILKKGIVAIFTLIIGQQIVVNSNKKNYSNEGCLLPAPPEDDFNHHYCCPYTHEWTALTYDPLPEFWKRVEECVKGNRAGKPDCINGKYDHSKSPECSTNPNGRYCGHEPTSEYSWPKPKKSEVYSLIFNPPKDESADSPFSDKTEKWWGSIYEPTKDYCERVKACAQAAKVESPQIDSSCVNGKYTPSKTQECQDKSFNLYCDDPDISEAQCDQWLLDHNIDEGSVQT